MTSLEPSSETPEEPAAEEPCTDEETKDDAERKAKYDAAREILSKNLPIIYLYHQTWIWALDKKVEGFKDTTLVSIISMFDLVGMIRGPILASTEWNGIYWELFLFIGVMFFIFCFSMGRYSLYLEKKLQREHR